MHQIFAIVYITYTKVPLWLTFLQFGMFDSDIWLLCSMLATLSMFRGNLSVSNSEHAKVRKTHRFQNW